jgi:hypothetical protein
MPLDRINTGKYHSDKQQSKNAAEEQLKFILGNQKYLLRVRNGDKLLLKIKSFMNQDFPLTENQKSEVDRICELVWKGYDMAMPESERVGSFQTTYKPNNRTKLRYG